MLSCNNVGLLQPDSAKEKRREKSVQPLFGAQKPIPSGWQPTRAPTYVGLCRYGSGGALTQPDGAGKGEISPLHPSRCRRHDEGGHPNAGMALGAIFPSLPASLTGRRDLSLLYERKCGSSPGWTEALPIVNFFSSLFLVCVSVCVCVWVCDRNNICSRKHSSFSSTPCIHWWPAIHCCSVISNLHSLITCSVIFNLHSLMTCSAIFNLSWYSVMFHIYKLNIFIFAVWTLKANTKNY